MKKRTILYILTFSTIVFGAGALFLTAQEGAKQQKQRIDVLKKGDLQGKDKKDIPPPSQREIDDAATPIVDYASAGQPVDDQRRLKNARYNNSDFVLRDVAPTTASVGKDTSDRSSDLPAAESDVVVEGIVTDSKAFLSEDATGVYSEFVIRITEVVKADPTMNLRNGSTIIGERFGGRVRYPSGKIVRYKIVGRGSPMKGQNYLFFLKRTNAGNFVIMTAYGFRKDKVFALDGSRVTGVGFGTSKEDKHNDKDIRQFKENVGKALRGEYK